MSPRFKEQGGTVVRANTATNEAGFLRLLACLSSKDMRLKSYLLQKRLPPWDLLYARTSDVCLGTPVHVTVQVASSSLNKNDKDTLRVTYSYCQ